MAFTMIPTIRPKEAPMAIDGTKMPAGTLHPALTITSAILMIVARRSEFTIRHCTDVLRNVQSVLLVTVLKLAYWQRLS
jgi:hypothetical protein